MREPELTSVRIGERVRFVPAAFVDNLGRVQDTDVPREVTGQIEYINHAHRYCRVGFEVCGRTLRECFKF